MNERISINDIEGAMRKRIGSLVLVFGAVGSMLACPLQAGEGRGIEIHTMDSSKEEIAEQSGLRPWTVEDSIGVRYFFPGIPALAARSPFPGDPVFPSPDGMHLFFVTRYGDLKTDENVYEMQIFSTAEIHRALHDVKPYQPPIRRFVMRSGSSRLEHVGIGPARWLSNSVIVFIGMPDGKTRELMCFDIKSGELQRVSDVGQMVRMFEIRSDSIVYSVEPLNITRDSFQNYPSVPIVRDELRSMLERMQIGRDMSGESFRVDRQGNAYKKPVVLRGDDGRWSKVAAHRNLSGGLSVSVRETLNDPPIMVVTNGAHELRLSEDDAALRGVARARVTRVEWSERDGKSVNAGNLFHPRSISRSHAPPLVIQVYQDNPTQFLPDGGSSMSAFAAQALAAQGMAVLMTDLPGWDYSRYGRNTPADLQDQSPHGFAARDIQGLIERIDAAVARLAADGLIDDRRVGFVGTSFAARLAHYALVQPGHTVLTAAVLNGGGASVAAEVDTLGLMPSFGGVVGRGGFREDPQDWMSRAPLFHLNRLRTRVFVQLPCSGFRFCVLEGAELVGAYAAAHKPLELEVYPAGEEQLQRPRERFESLSGTVDWMNFWLQGKEDPADSKKDKYARWRQMKSEWPGSK